MNKVKIEKLWVKIPAYLLYSSVAYFVGMKFDIWRKNIYIKMADRKAELAAKKEKLRQIREEKVGVHNFKVV